MALKNRETQEEEQTDPVESEVENDEAQGDDGDPDVDVERNGDNVIVKQRSAGTRGQRRAAEREDRHEKAMAELRAEVARQNKELRDLLLARQPAGAPPPPAKKGDDDELDEEYLDIVRQQDELAERTTRCKTQAEVDALSIKWHKLERKKLIATMPKPAAPAPGSDLTAEERQLVREFKPVVDNPVAFQLARSYYLEAEARAHQAKVPFNEAVAHRAAMTKAGEEMGIFRRAARPPNDAERGRFSGDRGGPTGGGGEVAISLTAAEKKAAKITFGDSGLSEEKIFRKYGAILMKDKAYMERRKG